MCAISLASVVFGVFAVFTAHVSAAGNPEKVLIRKILDSHETKVRPVDHPDDTLNVTISFSLTNIMDFDTDNNILTFHGMIMTLWDDASVHWSAKDQGIRDTRLWPYQLWTPDIRGYNTISEDEQYVPLLVFSSGSIWHVSPTTVKVQCNGNGDPSYDCIFKLGSWTYDGSKVALIAYGGDTNGLDMSTFQPHPRWNVTSATAARNVHQYNCCPEPYYDWQMNITITDLYA